MAEVPYQLPAVERDAMVCPVCERELPNPPQADEAHGGTLWREVPLQQMWQGSGIKVHAMGSPTCLHPREVCPISSLWEALCKQAGHEATS